jgi:hypothetical protein
MSKSVEALMDLILPGTRAGPFGRSKTAVAPSRMHIAHFGLAVKREAAE